MVCHRWWWWWWYLYYDPCRSWAYLSTFTRTDWEITTPAFHTLSGHSQLPPPPPPFSANMMLVIRNNKSSFCACEHLLQGQDFLSRLLVYFYIFRGLLYLAKAEKMTKQNYEVLIDRLVVLCNINFPISICNSPKNINGNDC